MEISVAGYMFNTTICFILAILFIASIGAMLRTVICLDIKPFGKECSLCRIYDNMTKKYLKNKTKTIEIVAAAIACLVATFGITLVYLVVWALDIILSRLKIKTK